MLLTFVWDETASGTARSKTDNIHSLWCSPIGVAQFIAVQLLYSVVNCNAGQCNVVYCNFVKCSVVTMCCSEVECLSDLAQPWLPVVITGKKVSISNSVFSLVETERHKQRQKDSFPEQGCWGVSESLKENCEITLQQLWCRVLVYFSAGQFQVKQCILVQDYVIQIWVVQYNIVKSTVV